MRRSCRRRGILTLETRERAARDLAVALVALARKTVLARCHPEVVAGRLGDDDIAGAMKSHRKVQLKGTWNKDKDASFDPATSRFTFFLVDEQGQECKVVLEGAAPNNFELATSVVAKGRFVEEGYFHATEVLTKCPSKYEAQGDEVKKSV